MFERDETDACYISRQVKISYVSCFPYRANVPIAKTIHRRHEGHVHSIDDFERSSNHRRVLVRSVKSLIQFANYS